MDYGRLPRGVDARSSNGAALGAAHRPLDRTDDDGEQQHESTAIQKHATGTEYAGNEGEAADEDENEHPRVVHAPIFAPTTA